MAAKSEKQPSCWLIVGCVAFLAGMTTFGIRSAEAQQVVARVNGVPITAVDVAQRIRMGQLSRKAPTQKEAIEELIEELLKLQAAQRYRIDIPDAEVDQVIASMASRMRTTPQQFTQGLAASGISVPGLKRKLRADLAWGHIVRGKFQSSLQVGEKDVAMALQARNKEKTGIVYEYTLQPILFLVASGSPPTAYESRRREADGLRTRFQGCEEGLRVARALREVAIRAPIIKNSGELPAKLRDVLESTGVGKVTPPDITPQGVEVFAICSKKESKGSGGAERDVREELFGERFQTQGKKYLNELRRQAKIEFK